MKPDIPRIRLWVALGLVTLAAAAHAQNPPELGERMRSLSEAVDRVQAQIEASQRELDVLRRELAGLVASGVAPASAPARGAAEEHSAAVELASAVAELRETQAMEQAQIATLEQSKAESDSKYPIKLSGTILMTSFINTRRADLLPSPNVAFEGAGSTGGTMRQTTLGIDARGPHLFGAESHANLRLDFAGSASTSGSSAGYSWGLARLRTAGAELTWRNTQAFFSLDRPILSPESPDSLTAVAVPPLAWSGNLWTWNPQLGASHDWLPEHRAHLRTQLAVIDVADAPGNFSAAAPGTYTPPGTAELSRWPGVEGRIALVSGNESEGLQAGVGGFFAPHRTTGGTTFDSWAGSADLRLPLSRYAALSAFAYRGQALGGMGAGAYKDYVALVAHGAYYFRALEDVGGWMQLKQHVGQRLELNEAVGMDNVPALQLRQYVLTNTPSYYSLARNRTITGNVIYRPSAYFLFSLEYRHIASSYVNYPTASSDVIGLAAGYRF